MSQTSLDPVALEAYLPHRGVNLFVDGITIAADGRQSESSTVVLPGDERGRELLGRLGADGRRYWQEPFLAELLALTGVCLLHEELAPQGLVGVFSSISRIHFNDLPVMEREVVGKAELARSRGDFWQFKAGLYQDGRELYSGEILSGAAPLSEIAAAPVQAQPLPAAEPLQADFSWKDAGLVFIDGVASADAASGELVATYTYPVDHHFVATHFPDGALMMGVTQWAAIFDAAIEAAARFDLGERYLASGSLQRPDGSEVVGVRDLDIGVVDGQPRILATKRVAFRDPVRPGDTLLAKVQVSRAG